ncbi:glycosyltransferase family 4 protein [Hydrogenophaga sp. XSHU_21]
MPAPSRWVFLVPGDWNTPTGGYVYDRRLFGSMRDLGWPVDAMRIDGAWPFPDATTLDEARRHIDALPDGTCVVADGLAFAVLGDVVAPHARRLRWVALVHHPLHLETGLDAATADALKHRETDALRHALQVVVTSPATATDVAALGVRPDAISVIEPGVDAPAAPVAPGNTRQGVQLLCVATLTPRKGHAVLLDALSELTRLDWTLHCVGSTARDPALAQALQARTATGPLAGRVVWHGEVAPHHLSPHYAAADVFVLASRHEGYGMVVAEAIAHSLPVLASRAGALVQTVPAGAGQLVPVDDVPAWRDALATLIGDSALRARMAGEARRAATRLPRWSDQAARMAGLLQHLPEVSP